MLFVELKMIEINFTILTFEMWKFTPLLWTVTNITKSRLLIFCYDISQKAREIKFKILESHKVFDKMPFARNWIHKKLWLFFTDKQNNHIYVV